MTASTNAQVADVESAAALPESERAAVRDLILVLADCKRLLGMRYADWTLGAPELEAGIGDLRFSRDVAEGRKSAALEAVRSRRAILSATQTLTSLVKEEAAFSRTGPT